MAVGPAYRWRYVANAPGAQRSAVGVELGHEPGAPATDVDAVLLLGGETRDPTCEFAVGGNEMSEHLSLVGADEDHDREPSPVAPERRSPSVEHRVVRAELVDVLASAHAAVALDVPVDHRM